MFTGLVAAVGEVVAVVGGVDGGRDLTIACPWRDLEVGESIAVDGACLTVTHRRGRRFTVHVVDTTFDRTLFAWYRPGQLVNLERALRAGDRLGGHLVQGHVDGIATIRTVRRREDAVLMDLAVPAAVARVSVPLGSITMDGVSLTVVARPGPGTVRVSLIPFTLEHTTLGQLGPGDQVHVEGDLLGKHVEALMKGRRGRRP